MNLPGCSLSCSAKIFALFSLCSVLCLVSSIPSNESSLLINNSPSGLLANADKVDVSNFTAVDDLAEAENLTTHDFLTSTTASTNITDASEIFETCQRYGWIDSEAQYAPATNAPATNAPATAPPPRRNGNLCYYYLWTDCKKNAEAKNISYSMEETCYPRIDYCKHSFCTNNWFLLRTVLDGWLNNLMSSGCTTGRSGGKSIKTGIKRNVDECKYATGFYSMANMVVTNDRPYDFSYCACEGLLCNRGYNNTNIIHRRIRYPWHTWIKGTPLDLFANYEDDITIENYSSEDNTMTENSTTADYDGENVSRVVTKEEVREEAWAPEVIASAVINGILVLLCLGLIVALVLIIRSRKQKDENSYKVSYSSSPATSVTENGVPEIDIDFSKTTPIRQGRFGKLYVLPNSHNGYKCLAKVLDKQDFAAWDNERIIYEHPGLHHENILRYFGSSGSPQLCLVLRYHVKGSLQDYMKGHTLTWDETMTIMYTLMKGLAHLHQLIQLPNGMIKYPIAHRDIKSTNIILDDRLCAKIGDFNLAQILPTVGLTDANDPKMRLRVGTVRYMSPEILSGQISYMRAAIIQTDVYAAGLVLWEIFSRYERSLSGHTEYKQPYHQYTGEAPSVEDMHQVVCIEQKRPEFAEHDDATVSELISTIRASWEHDGEARLTAKCIELRIESMLSPNCNTAMCTDSEGYVSISSSA